MRSPADRKKAFNAIDTNGNGIIEFKEWYKHFDALVRNGKKTEKELLDLYKAYEGDSEGINFEEYNQFMDEVFGSADYADLRGFAEQKINHYAEMIVTHKGRADDLAMGELQFYMSLRRVLTGQASMQDSGLIDAINDVLQELGLVKQGKTFLG